MNIVNLTPHRIVIFSSADATEPSVVVEPSGQVARVGYREISSTVVDDGIPVTRSMLTGVTGLPEPAEGVFFITSGMVLDYLGVWGPQRPDVVSPGELVRDADGRPVGCLGLRGI